MLRSRRKERKKETGEGVLFAHDADHLSALDAEGDAGGDGGGGGHAEADDGGDGLLADEVTSLEQGDGGFLAAAGDDGELGAATLDVIDGVGLVSLLKKVLLRLDPHDLATQPGLRKELGRIKR
jgi:hypothetical protein